VPIFVCSGIGTAGGGMVGAILAWHETSKMWSESGGSQGAAGAVLLTPILLVGYVGAGALCGFGAGMVAGIVAAMARVVAERRRARASLGG
jgi:hypothetical protein